MEKKKNLMCFGCKKMFPRETLITYAARGGTSYNFCTDCYQEKKKKEKFADYVCELFNLRAPGPMLYSQRKRLINQGFTDETIMMTLEYLYRVCSNDVTQATLGLVNSLSIESARQYYSKKEARSETLGEKVNNQKVTTHYFSVQKEKEVKKEETIDLNSLMEEW